MIYQVQVDGVACTLELKAAAGNAGRWICRLDGEEIEVDAVLVERDILSILVKGNSFEARNETGAEGRKIRLRDRTFLCEVRDPRALRGRRSIGDAAHQPRKISAPMPGKVVRVVAPVGTQVEAGQGVIVIEAMKMQNELKSPKKGTVRKILAAEGATVRAGETLAIIE